MAAPVFIANAIMAVTGIALCAWHAYPDRDRLSLLGTGIVYGVLLEQLVILHFEAYQYNVEDFLLTVADVPIVIGLGWAAIIYAGIEIGQQVGLSDRALPFFVAPFALHIDLAIDAVAIRIPFWQWTPPGIWFGVPLGNFMGWFLVAGLFSAAWVATADRVPFPPVQGVLSIIGAVLGLVLLLEVWTSVATTVPRKVAILGPLVFGSLVVVSRADIEYRPIDRRIVAIPLLYHGFYLILLLGYGMYHEQPLMLLVSLLMLGIGVAVVHGGAIVSMRTGQTTN